MRKIVSITMVVVFVAAMCLTLTACGGKPYRIGICQLRPHAALDAATQGFQDAIVESLGEDDVEFLVRDAQGDPDACTAIVREFVEKEVDLILGNATDALRAAAGVTDTIPVLGASVTDYSLALGLEAFDGTVGTNVSGTSDLAPLDEQAAIILDLFPDAETVGLLYTADEANSIYQVSAVRAYLEIQGITCTDFLFSVGADGIAAVSAAVAEASDVLYIPTDNTAATYAQMINATVLPIGTPIVVGGDPDICRGCGVATLAIDYYDLGAVTGRMAVEILTGREEISEMPIAYAETFTKIYNPRNCQALGIDIAALEANGYTALEG